MGRATVRSTVVEFLQNAGIDFVSTVYGSPDKTIPEGAWFANVPAGTGSGVVILVHLERQTEYLAAYPAMNGGKRVRPFNVLLLCYLRSVKPDVESVQDDNDTFIDQLVAALEEAPDLNNPSVVFTSALGMPQHGQFGFDIQVDADIPRTIKQQVTEIFTTTRFVVTEVVST